MHKKDKKNSNNIFRIVKLLKQCKDDIQKSIYVLIYIQIKNI